MRTGNCIFTYLLIPILIIGLGQLLIPGVYSLFEEKTLTSTRTSNTVTYETISTIYHISSVFRTHTRNITYTTTETGIYHTILEVGEGEMNYAQFIILNDTLYVTSIYVSHTTSVSAITTTFCTEYQINKITLILTEQETITYTDYLLFLIIFGILIVISIFVVLGIHFRRRFTRTETQS